MCLTFYYVLRFNFENPSLLLWIFLSEKLRNVVRNFSGTSYVNFKKFKENVWNFDLKNVRKKEN